VVSPGPSAVSGAVKRGVARAIELSTADDIGLASDTH
jgi:hypothetical protein